MIESVTLLGSSSGRNAGDAALMSGIMEAVDAAVGRELRYEIPTIAPNFVRRTYHNNVRPISMLPWNLSVKMLGLPTYRSVMRSDWSLVFDAILFDRALYNPLFNFLSTLYLLLPYAKRSGKRLAFYNVGAGPVKTPLGKKMLRELADNMDFITVRDQDSLDLLLDLGVSEERMLLTADAALNVPASKEERTLEIMNRLGFAENEQILAINVNAYIDTWAAKNREPLSRDQFLSTYAKALNQVIQQLGVSVLFVATQHHDLNITQDLMSRLYGPRKVAMMSNTVYDHFDVKAVLSKCQLLFGMRLHAMILGSSALTPIIGLAYQPKCDYYFRTLGLPQFCMSFDDFSEESLVQHMISGWERKAQLREQLSRVVPMLQNEARKAALLLAAADRGEDVVSVIKRLKSGG